VALFDLLTHGCCEVMRVVGKGMSERREGKDMFAIIFNAREPCLRPVKQIYLG
jgi:hypothetical protein